MVKRQNIFYIAYLIFMTMVVVSSCSKDEALPPVEVDQPKPTADFSYKLVDENDPFTIVFDNASSNFDEVRWEFGDDSTTYDENPTHTYINTGEYKVRMIVTNEQGYWAQKETVIELFPDSLLGFKADLGGDGLLTLSLNRPFNSQSIGWFKGQGTLAEQVGEGETAKISVDPGVFEQYSVRVVTPKGSKIEVDALVSTQGVVNDVTEKAYFSVSRDNDQGKTAGEGSLKLIDNNRQSKFLQFNYTGDLWTQFDYDNKPVVISAYMVTSANDAPERDPKDWVLEASDDGVTWIVLDSQVDQIFETRFLEKIYIFENITPYRYYRMNFKANQGAGLIQIAELRLLSKP